jgi:hypothetical protein
MPDSSKPKICPTNSVFDAPTDHDGLLGILQTCVLSTGVEKHVDAVGQIIERGSEKTLRWLKEVLQNWTPANRTQKALKGDFRSRVDKRLETENAPEAALKSLLDVLTP